MIEVEGLTKQYKSVRAVDDLTFQVKPGMVTGFLGPNGAGKSTTMRMILGLDTPTAGRARINGKHYHELKHPLREVGALLDAKAVHRNRSAANHLKWIAQSNGISTSRVDEVLGLVGLSDVAGKKVGGFSLGMNQRLGIAAALLGDPEYLILDEPVNGLDPQGVAWMRGRIREMAAEGRAVVVSSHLMSEMQLTADRLVVINRGRLAGEGPLEDFLGSNRVEATCSDPARLAEAVGGQVIGDSVVVDDATARDVGEAAQRAGVTVYSLQESRRSLEEVFLESTK